MIQLAVLIIQRWKATIPIGLLLYFVVGVIYPPYHFRPLNKNLEIRDDERNLIRGKIPAGGSRNVIWDVYRLRSVDSDHYLLETSNGNIVFKRSESEQLHNILSAYNRSKDNEQDHVYGVLSCGEFKATKAVYERLAGIIHLPSTEEDETPALQLSPLESPELKWQDILNANSLRLLPKYRVPRLLGLLDKIPDLERVMKRRESSPILESWIEIFNMGLGSVTVH
jgi:hypothetical protein